MSDNWIDALTEYVKLREEIGRLEETGECSCDANEFHQCQLCADETALSMRGRQLMNLYSDTWAMKLFHKLEGN